MPLSDLALVDPRIRQMFEYWSPSARGDVPSREQVDPPLDIPEVAPALLMFSVIDGGPGFMTRLAGTRTTERFGRETTGKMLGALLVGQYRQTLLTLPRRCVDERRPIYSLTNYLDPNRNHSMVGRLMTPLRLGGSTVDMVLALRLCPGSALSIGRGNAATKKARSWEQAFEFRVGCGGRIYRFQSRAWRE